MKPINKSKQLEVDINFAFYVYCERTLHIPIPIAGDFTFDGATREGWTWDRDLHYVHNLPVDKQMTDTGIWDITIDVGDVLQKAFDYWKIQSGTLKSFDIYIFAIYGSGAVTIDYVEFVLAPRIDSGYVIAQSGLNGVTAFILTTFLKALYERFKEGSKR